MKSLQQFAVFWAKNLAINNYFLRWCFSSSLEDKHSDDDERKQQIFETVREIACDENNLFKCAQANV